MRRETQRSSTRMARVSSLGLIAAGISLTCDGGLAPGPFSRLAVTGTVTDNSGQPVQGAVVIATIRTDYSAECSRRSNRTGGRTDRRGNYFVLWGTPRRVSGGCLEVLATPGDSASALGQARVEQRVEFPDTVTVHLKLPKRP